MSSLCVDKTRRPGAKSEWPKSTRCLSRGNGSALQGVDGESRTLSLSRGCRAVKGESK